MADKLKKSTVSSLPLAYVVVAVATSGVGMSTVSLDPFIASGYKDSFNIQTSYHPVKTITTIKGDLNDLYVRTVGSADYADDLVSEKEIWETVDALFGAWGNIGSDAEADEWLDTLRNHRGSRLKEIYGDEWE